MQTLTRYQVGALKIFFKQEMYDYFDHCQCSKINFRTIFQTFDDALQITLCGRRAYALPWSSFLPVAAYRATVDYTVAQRACRLPVEQFSERAHKDVNEGFDDI